MKIEVKKRHLFVILGAILVLAITMGVIATVNTNLPYHSVNQIADVPSCTFGQFLTQNATGWFCQTPASASASSSGVVLGGGANGIGTLSSCTFWGSATCSGSSFVCPAGSTKRTTAAVSTGDGWTSWTAAYYICVKN